MRIKFLTVILAALALNANAATNTTNIVNLNHSVAKANVIMSGIIHSNHGYFEGNVMITSDEVMMNASTVKGSVTIKSPEKNPVLSLRCGTQILGKVIFQGKPGVIKKSADSIVKDKVVNGTIEETKFEEKCS